MCQIVGLNNYDLSYNYFYSIKVKLFLLHSHETKQDTPRVGSRQRTLVRNDSKRQPYPGNTGKGDTILESSIYGFPFSLILR